jgi:hypothetical protein
MQTNDRKKTIPDRISASTAMKCNENKCHATERKRSLTPGEKTSVVISVVCEKPAAKLR